MPFITAAVTAIGSAIGLAAGAGLATFVAIGKAVIGIGFQLIAKKIQQNAAKKNQKSVTGTSFERDYGENVSRKVACGLVGIAGHDCYVNTYDKSNKRLEQVFAFSDYPCDGLSQIWAGGTLLQLSMTSSNAFSATYDVVNHAEFAGRMSFVFYNGTQTVADAGLIANANPTGRWTIDHVGHGMCYMIARLEYDQEKLAQFPDFFFEIRGARLYDPRKDSTVGGSGGHRWGDYSTHEFSRNPIIMDYNYRRGFAWGVDSLGRPDIFLGMDMDVSDLPIDKFAIASSICDEVEGGEPRYVCSIMLDADADHGDNIDALMASCAGMVIDSVDGSWPLIGTEQPIVATFTDDDLVIAENVRFQRRRSMAELVNSVGGTYPEPANMWSPAGYDTQTSVSQVALDRRTRDMQVNFETVPSKRQANQLASIYYNENRYEATADVTLRPFFQDIRVGDWVRWDSVRYGSRIYIVQSRFIRALTTDGPRNVVLALQERSGDIYAGAGTIPPTVPIPNGEPVYLNELQDWAVIPVLSVAQDGRTYPAFRMSWSVIDDVTVEGVQFRWWPENEPTNVFYRTVPKGVTLAFIQEGIVGKRRYVFEHKLIAPTRTTNWSSPVTQTSLDGGNGDLEVYLGNLQKEVLDVFEKLFAGLDDVRPLVEQLMTNFQHEAVSQEIARRKLEVTVGNSSAFFEEQIAVVANEVEAAAAQITQIGATVGDISAQGLIKFSVAANQAGVDARFAVLIRGSTGVAYKETGFFLELYTELGVQKSRFAVMSDQFIVTNGVSSALPMVFENGELKLQIANIGTIRAALMISPSGRTVFNLAADFLSFSD
ncbi:phage tail protein [Endobacterium cereale]|uniref:phage tail protein n=1 Tax=Endobacterium cereale TaxID=2663029 RepID=UPI002B48287E|nr:phage tail protein [Endobacterium cereale]MEB2845935.1 phage tail protein [Endobacterium cereale]